MGTKTFELKNKIVLVTGASSGIGRQCAISCSQAGAKVVIMGRDRIRLQETLNTMFKPERHLLYSVDLLEFDIVSEVVKDLVLRIGKINGLINCAGISTTVPLNAITPQRMEHFFRTNVTGPILLTKQVVKRSNFIDSGGSIVFISSVMGVAGESGKTMYAITKGALIAAVKSLAIELSPRHIRVNSVSPGVVETPMSKNAVYSMDKVSFSRMEALHPLGLGKPEYVANTCTFLLTEAASWITGTNVVVDGGYLAK